MTGAFTPGPWHVGYGINRVSVYFTPSGVGDAPAWNKKNAVATFDRNEEGEANARLMAASPDLISALREVLDAYVPGWEGEEYSDIGGSVMHARKALRKVRGDA